MEKGAPHNSAIVGCGPSGCFLLSLLRQSHAKAKLIAVDSDESSLQLAEADQSIKVSPGDKPAGIAGAFEIVFCVFDPSEGQALDYAKAISSSAAADGAYVYALALNKPGNSLSEAEVAREFGGTAVIDAAWVMEKRGDSDDERALQIAFNFAAHTLTFLAGAIDAGDLSIAQFKDTTAGGIAGFAASHLSEADAIYALTLSRIDKSRVKAGIVFLDSGTSDVLARRIFLGVLRGISREARMNMLRGGGLEPFKVLALLVH